MRFAFYGDDFTGSVDALLQFRQAGLAGILVTETAALDDLDVDGAEVVGVAGVARALATAALSDEVGPALRALLRLSPQIVQYKACSTADSSASVGSLGRVLEIARELLPHGPVPVCFAQPDFGRFTFFGHHFARDGEAVYRLDRQPTMRAHPVTPATESDLTRLLEAQTDLPIGSLTWPSYENADAVAKTLARSDVAAVVCDAFTDEQLDRLAAAVLADPRRPRFVLGSGGLSSALGRTTDLPRRLAPLPGRTATAAGPVLVLSGSRSARTARQVERAAEDRWPVLDLFLAGTEDEAVARHAHGESVIVTSALAPQARTQEEIVHRLSTIAARCVGQNTNTRLLICGGDTSGRVLRRLDVRALTVEAAPWGNVAMCRARRANGPDFDVVLKGGQMGDERLFTDVARGCSERDHNDRGTGS